MKSSSKIAILCVLVLLLLVAAIGIFIFTRHSTTKENNNPGQTNATYYASLTNNSVPYLVDDNDDTIILVSTDDTKNFSTSTTHSIKYSQQDITKEYNNSDGLLDAATTTTSAGTQKNFDSDGTKTSNDNTIVDDEMDNPPFCLLEEFSYSKMDCQMTSRNEDFNDDWLNPGFDLPEVSSLIRPLSYDLNITLANKNAPVLFGSVTLYLEVINDTANLLLHADRQISDLDIEQIKIKNCANGRIVCVKSVTRLIDQKVILLTLSEHLAKGTYLLVQISNFETEIFSNPGLYQQIPSKWERDRAWVLSSIFENIGAKSVFPCVDNHFSRASLHLCLQYPKELSSRSNMPSERTTSNGEIASTCFAKSPATTTHQYAFILFDNMQLMTSNSSSGIELEIFVGKHLELTECQWIINEGLQKMEELTGVSFPISKLTVISSVLEADGISSLGLILIKETWIEYPKYLLPHTILIRQLVHQWFSNILMLCTGHDNNPCIQHGLTTYLEWVINSDLATFNVSTHKRFIETKHKLLASAGEKPLLSPSADSVRNECEEQVALIFYMLEYNFGSLQNLLKKLMEKFAWGSCVPTDIMAKFAADASNSPLAQELFKSYTSSTGYPLIKAKLFTNGSFVIAQDNERIDKHFILPIEILNEQRQSQRFVLGSTQFTTHLPANFVLLDPDQHLFARFVYNVENYKKLKECYELPTTCKIPRDVLKNAFNDLCFAFLSNRLDNSGQNVREWNSFFDGIGNLASELGLRDCECCMRPQKESAPRCKWIWRDKCSKLNLAPQKR